MDLTNTAAGFILIWLACRLYLQNWSCTTENWPQQVKQFLTQSSFEELHCGLEGWTTAVTCAVKVNRLCPLPGLTGSPVQRILLEENDHPMVYGRKIS